MSREYDVNDAESHVNALIEENVTITRERDAALARETALREALVLVGPEIDTCRVCDGWLAIHDPELSHITPGHNAGCAIAALSAAQPPAAAALHIHDWYEFESGGRQCRTCGESHMAAYEAPPAAAALERREAEDDEPCQ